MNTKFIYITKAERRGTLLFFVVIFITITVQLININQRNDNDPETNRDVLETLEKEGILEKIKTNHSSATNTTLSPKVIDPNNASTEELKAIGMSPYAVKSLLSFRSFTTIKNEEDLSKAYGIDSTILKTIRPYIKYPEITLTKNRSKRKKPTPQLPKQPTDPNTASKEELMAVGFSKFSSNNIIKIREKGASLKNIVDIKKIYGVDKKTLNQVSKYLVFDAIDKKSNLHNDTTSITKPTPPTFSSDNFDPNTATHKELVAHGIPAKISHTIIKFRNGRKVFHNTDDLLKVYGMTSTLLDSLRDRITLAPMEDSVDSTLLVTSTIIDLSTTTPEELLKIDGIGKYFSEAIVNYRDALGGYLRIEQLEEVPGMKPEVYEKLKGKFGISGKIKKFVPIALDFREALSHPYMDFETTKLLHNLSANDYEVELEKLIKKGMVDSRLIPYLLSE